MFMVFPHRKRNPKKKKQKTKTNNNNNKKKTAKLLRVFTALSED
jgi:hypothetical protein